MRELVISYWSNRRKVNLVPICIGVVYVWFGVLKFFSGLSPAEELAKNTIDQLTFGIIPSDYSIILLAIWETIIGLLLIGGFYKKLALRMALVHIVFTFSPFIFFPELLFTDAPFALTLLGQYIVKNLIILGILVVLLRENQRRKI